MSNRNDSNKKGKNKIMTTLKIRRMNYYGIERMEVDAK
jgi:hypothetical protein